MHRRWVSIALVPALIAGGALLGSSRVANAGFLEAITQQSGAKLPRPTEGYQPRTEFSAPVERVFDAALEMFDRNRIDAAHIDRQNHRLMSDYIAGPTYMTAFGLLGFNTARYKFTLVFKPISPTVTRVDVRVRVESSGDAVQSWRDVSQYNPEVVRDLEGWMYEQLERALER